MAGELILITGGTGHLGYRIIVDALEAGYRVRAAVRNVPKGEKVFEAPSVKAINPGSNLELVAVPDMLAPGAYDNAIKDATYAIHVASPLAEGYKEGDDAIAVLIDPAVKGTINMLEAAQKSGSVKRIVITSSVVALHSFADLVSGNTDRVYNEKDRTSFLAPPYVNSFAAYAASKIKALNDAEEWVKTINPSFSVNHIHPAFIIGANELATTPEAALQGTNATALGSLIGRNQGPIPGCSNLLLDVSLAHVRALDPKVPGNESFIVCGPPAKWESAKEIVEREFPEAVSSGKLSLSGSVQTIPVLYDTERSEKLLGLKYSGLEEQVKSAVEGYLSVL